MPYPRFERGEWQLSGHRLMETNVRSWPVAACEYGSDTVARRFTANRYS